MPVVSLIPYPNLKMFHLDHLGIRHVSDFAFQNLTHLEKLSMVGNRITGLTASTFSGLVSLELLFLEGNPLYVVESGVFSGVNMPRLVELKLKDCQLYEMERNAFRGLGHLRLLDLSENHLETFPDLDEDVSMLTHLTHLYMSRNRLTSLDSENLRIPRSLTELKLEENRIRSVRLTVTKESALANSSLSELHLTRNRISTFETKGLELMRNLSTIDLEWNELKTVEYNSFPWKSSVLTRVLVSYNPWDCSGCGNSWIVEQSVVNKFNHTTIKCGFPVQFLNQSVFSSRVFSGCQPGGQSPGQSPVVIVVALIVTTILVVGLFLVLARRCRRRRMASQLRQSVKQQTQQTNSTFSYRQMENMSSPFSIGDDD